VFCVVVWHSLWVRRGSRDFHIFVSLSFAFFSLSLLGLTRTCEKLSGWLAVSIERVLPKVSFVGSFAARGGAHGSLF